MLSEVREFRSFHAHRGNPILPRASSICSIVRGTNIGEEDILPDVKSAAAEVVAAISFAEGQGTQLGTPSTIPFAPFSVSFRREGQTAHRGDPSPAMRSTCSVFLDLAWSFAELDLTRSANANANAASTA